MIPFTDASLSVSVPPANRTWEKASPWPQSLQHLKFESFACINVNPKYWNINCITSWNQTLTFRYNNTNLSIQELTLLLFSQPFRVGTNNKVAEARRDFTIWGFH